MELVLTCILGKMAEPDTFTWQMANQTRLLGKWLSLTGILDKWLNLTRLLGKMADL